MTYQPYTLAAELKEWQKLLSDAEIYHRSLPDNSPKAKNVEARIKHYRQMIEVVLQDIEAEKKAIH